MTRDYSKIELPYTLPHWKLGFALERIRPYWGKLPTPFLKKFNSALSGGQALVITKEDLDSLSDEMWQVLQEKLA
jgi:hypothetical protein